VKARLAITALALACGVVGLAQEQQQRQSTPGTIHFFVDPSTNSDDTEDRRAYGLSVTPPWPDGGELVMNLPEHLEYMPGTRGIARHHDKRQNAWRISRNGTEASYAIESLTEPGVFFGMRARVAGDGARFEMSITNRSDKTLKSIRPLLCFQYHRLRGFPAANSDNLPTHSRSLRANQSR
jgi:hypothetical protein